MQTRLLRALLWFAAVMLIVGFSAVPGPTNTTAWRDPDFNGPPFRKILVIGLSANNLTDQRGFENLMVSMLQTIGAVGVPGWQYVTTDGTADQATIRAAVARSSADAVLLVRPSALTTEPGVGIAPGSVAGPGIYEGWYGPAIVTDSVQVATIYTTLFDVRTGRPVWTFNSPTYNLAALQQDASGYASDVAGRLQSSGLLALL